MKKMRSLIFGSLAAASENMGASTGASETVTDQETREITVLNATPVDPKVAEFFKDFPQPYREKAIQRFSSRDGLYRWDFYRDSQMQQEINAALQGIFLEDKREADELEIQKAEQDRLNDYEERKRNFKDRDIPEWEQQSLKFIPLQPGDRMSRKLLQSGSCALTGVLSLGMAVSAIRQKSSKTRRQDILCGLTLFCAFGWIAAARLLDWDLFDRSVDDRPVHVKLGEEAQNTIQQIQDFLNKSSTRP